MHFAIRAFKCACNYMLQFMWLEIHASTEAFTWFLYISTPLATESHNLFSRGQKDAPNSLSIHAN
jgi:hypothetical protein